MSVIIGRDIHDIMVVLESDDPETVIEELRKGGVTLDLDVYESTTPTQVILDWGDKEEE